MAEKFANNYQTTLNGAIDASVTTITVDSVTGAPAGGAFRIIIGSEIILVGAISGNDFTGCTRGAEGTTAASHADEAAVTHILTAGGLVQALSEVSAVQVPDASRLLVPAGFTPPVSGDYSDWQTNPTLNWEDEGLITQHTGWISVDRAVTAPYIFTVFARGLFHAANQSVGVYCRQAGTWALAFGIQIGSGVRINIFNESRAFQGSYHSGSNLVSGDHLGFGLFFQIEDDATNRYFRYSLDGRLWVTTQSAARTATITANRVGLWCESQSSNVQAHFLHALLT